MFVSIKEAASRLGYSEQTVRNRIADKSLRAIQSAPGGAYRVPIMEIEAFKRRHGLAPRVEPVMPNGVVHADPVQVLEETLGPALAAHGLSSPEEILRAVAQDPSLVVEYADVLTAYAAYANALSARQKAAAG
jgi:excisionase family DNA binding protein